MIIATKRMGLARVCMGVCAVGAIALAAANALGAAGIASVEVRGVGTDRQEAINAALGRAVEEIAPASMEVVQDARNQSLEEKHAVSRQQTRIISYQIQGLERVEHDHWNARLEVNVRVARE